MVYFSCDGCSETLKKNQVDSHARRCRNCESVSCVDCSVSFWGDDYKYHTSCISEAERYEKTLYKGPKKNDTANRKLTPQEAWMEIIGDSIENCPGDLKPHLESIAGYDNVPRKERPFRNFAMNSLKLRGTQAETITSGIWTHLSTVRAEKQKAKKTQEDKGKTCVPVDKEVQITTNETEGTTIKEKKDTGLKTMQKEMKKALKKAPKKQMKFKELRKIMKSKSFQEVGKSELKRQIMDTISKSKGKLVIEGELITLS